MKKILFLIAVTAMTVLGARAQEVEMTNAQEVQEVSNVQEEQEVQKAVARPSRVPAYRGMIEYEQPNGEILRTYLRGDERSHFSMTEDGWEIIADPKGWMKYAKRNRKGEKVISCRKAHNVEKRSRCEKRWLERKGIVRN